MRDLDTVREKIDAGAYDSPLALAITDTKLCAAATEGYGAREGLEDGDMKTPTANDCIVLLNQASAALSANRDIRLWAIRLWESTDPNADPSQVYEIRDARAGLLRALEIWAVTAPD